MQVSFIVVSSHGYHVYVVKGRKQNALKTRDVFPTYYRNKSTKKGIMVDFNTDGPTKIIPKLRHF